MTSFSTPISVCRGRDMLGMSADGGALLWLELLASTRVLHDLPERVAGESQGWTDGQMMLAVILLNLLGHDRVSDVDALEADASLRALVSECEPSVLGRSRKEVRARFRGGRGRVFPSANSLHDWLERFHGAESGARLRVIEEVSRRLAACLIRERGRKELTLDLDATIVASGKREAHFTYRAATGQKPREKGFQPFQIFSPDLGMVLGTEFRDGHVPASARNLEVLVEVLSGLPEEVRKIRIRSDCAGYQEAILDFCNDPESRPEALRRFGVIEYVIGAPRTGRLLAAAAETPEGWWRPRTEGETRWECADLDGGVSVWGARQRRYVATRQARPGELGMGEDETPATDDRPAYRWRFYATNLAHPGEPGGGSGRVMSARGVVRLAHRRCGHGEEVHAALKRDLAGGMLPSGKFGANAAWWLLAALTHNLTALLRRCGLGREWAWKRMKALRRRWLHLVGQVVRHARRLSLQFVGEIDLRVRRVLARIARLAAYDTS